MHSADLCSNCAGNESVSQGDFALVMAMRAGSPTAFAELQRLYAPRLYRKILSITKNHEDAEDVLQETLMRAYLAVDTFEGRSKLLSWLTRIAINTSLMTLRKPHIRREASLDSLSYSEDEVPQFQVKDPNPNPEECCLQGEARLRLARALAALKPSLRTVVEIQMNGDCSMKEMAKSLRLSIPTVKARLHRVRRRLAERVRN